MDSYKVFIPYLPIKANVRYMKRVFEIGTQISQEHFVETIWKGEYWFLLYSSCGIQGHHKE